MPEVIKGPTGTPPKNAAAITAPNIKEGIMLLCPCTVKYLTPTPLRYVVNKERTNAIIPVQEVNMPSNSLLDTLPFAMGIIIAAISITNPQNIPFFSITGNR